MQNTLVALVVTMMITIRMMAIMIIFIFINRLVVRNTLVTDVKQAARTFVRAWTEFSFSVRTVVMTTARIIIEVERY